MMMFNQLLVMVLEERKVSVLFRIPCENLREKLILCGDKSLTDTALLNKLPLSMQSRVT